MADLICYRGENHDRWGPPELRLNDGLTVRDPLRGGSLPRIRPADVRTSLVLQIQSALKDKIKPGDDIPKKEIALYAQNLRKEGRNYAIATARTLEVSYSTCNSVYTIAIPSARTFRWESNLTLGHEVHWVTTTDAINEDYIVLDASSIEESSIFGFGHKIGTWEVTFFTDLSESWVTKVNKAPFPRDRVKRKPDFTMEEQIFMGKLVRPPFKFT